MVLAESGQVIAFASLQDTGKCDCQIRTIIKKMYAVYQRSSWKVTEAFIVKRSIPQAFLYWL
jgi:hypothetical protein